MKTIRVSEARADLYRLIDEAGQSHEPIKIMGKRGNAIIISEDDWRAVEETLYLLSIPGMRESVAEGMRTRLDKCVDKLNW